MKSLSTVCTYWQTEAEQCQRAPVSADYFEIDPIRGEKYIASLCARHDNPAARRFALARGYERRDRKPTLSIVQSVPAHI